MDAQPINEISDGNMKKAIETNIQSLQCDPVANPELDSLNLEILNAIKIRDDFKSIVDKKFHVLRKSIRDMLVEGNELAVILEEIIMESQPEMEYFIAKKRQARQRFLADNVKKYYVKKIKKFLPKKYSVDGVLKLCSNDLNILKSVSNLIKAREFRVIRDIIPDKRSILRAELDEIKCDNLYLWGKRDDNEKVFAEVHDYLNRTKRDLSEKIMLLKNEITGWKNQ